MGLFSSQKKQDDSIVVPPEIAARVRVMNDDLSQAGDYLDTPSEPAVIPSSAISAPHGPFAESIPKPTETSTAPSPVLAVSETAAQSSPFLKSLPKEELVVSRKEKISPEPPMFFSQKDQQNNPFGFSQSVPFQNSNAIFGTEKSPVSFSDTVPKVPEASKHTAWWVFAILLIVFLSALGGAYYYLYTYLAQKPVEDITPEKQEITPVASDTNQSTNDFSLSSPNYLPLNIETVSASDILTQIQNMSERVRLSGVTQPIEFLVTDQTNTPIAFSRFILLSGLKLPESSVNLTDEMFSMYFFNDQGNVRVGFRIHLKSAETSAQIIRKVEGDLPIGFQGIFFAPNVPIAKKALFKQSLYNGIVIRYSNLVGATNLSIDYAITQGDWYIGTSKNTLRSLLDLKKK